MVVSREGRAAVGVTVCAGRKEFCVVRSSCCGFDLHQHVIFSSQLPLLVVWGVSVTLSLAWGACRSSRE